jgi:tRNA (guanine37-N1)-methyltransferase
MKINFVTGFPTFFDSPLKTSMLKKACDKGCVHFEIYDLKDYTISKHKTIDDEPFGGKPGMVLKPEPFFRAMQHIHEVDGAHPIIYCGPEGQTFKQEIAKSFVSAETITFLCGHFKGIDNRVLDEFVTTRLSIGDYIITGGELAALVVSDAIVRLLPGVLNTIKSAETDSFEDGLLDSDHYTRPANFLGKTIPEELLSGHHERIEQWTHRNKIEKTLRFKPQLIDTKK